jgi:hypothetical protein
MKTEQDNRIQMDMKGEMTILEDSKNLEDSWREMKNLIHRNRKLDM